VETLNKRADELEAVVASERAARLASDQRMSDVLAFLQSSLGVTLPPNLMGPPQPPPVVPPFVALHTTPVSNIYHTCMLFTYLTLSHAIAALVCSLSRRVRTKWRTSMGYRRRRQMGGPSTHLHRRLSE